MKEEEEEGRRGGGGDLSCISTVVCVNTKYLEKKELVVAFSVQHSVFSMLSIQHLAVSSQDSTLNSQQSVFSIQCSVVYL
jgi:hypothetical protein